MNVELFKEIIFNAGPWAGLAIFAIWRLDRAWQLRLEAEQRNTETEKRHSAEIEALYKQSLSVIQANTEAMTALRERLDRP